MNRRAIASTLSLAFPLTAIACEPTAPLELRPWTRDVPAETATIVHAPIAPERRSGAVRLVQDLVIEEREDDLDYLLGDRMPHVSVDDRGWMYVADVGNARLLVYDDRGEHVRTLGRSGQGPGEFSFPIASVVAGGRIFISDSNASRLSRWTMDGALDWDRRVELFPGYLIHPMLGLPDGTWLARLRLPRTQTEVVAHMSTEGERMAEFAPLEVPGRTGYPPDNPRLMIWVGATPSVYAPAPDGTVYVSSLSKYQVYSFDLGGSMRWALQVPAEPAALEDVEKEWATGWFSGQTRTEILASELEWPERTYALADLKVDGRGRVFAFPYVARGVTHARLPVDVYAPDGSRLLAGWLENDIEGIYWRGSWKPGPLLSGTWQTTRGDFVYGVLEDPVTGVYRVVRYRIEVTD